MTQSPAPLAEQQPRDLVELSRLFVEQEVEQEHKQKHQQERACMCTYFETSGAHNTDATLKIGFEAAAKRRIPFVVIASTTGATAERALEFIHNEGAKLIVVTHNYGFAETGVQQFSIESRQKVIAAGGIVHTGTMPLRNVGAAIRKRFGYSEEELINSTLRIFGQGAKVCVEMAAMVCDAGLVPPQDIVAIAGTERGADTALIVAANSSNRFFDIRIREVLAKPR